MRGDEKRQPDLFLYGTLEQRIPETHPLRPVREMTDIALEALTKRFDEMYAKTGRPSIPPEQLLRALLLQALYSIRSERMLVEQLEYNLLFRWFVGLGMNDRAWNHAVFSKNRERLLAGDVAAEFFACVVEPPLSRTPSASRPGRRTASPEDGPTTTRSGSAHSATTRTVDDGPDESIAKRRARRVDRARGSTTPRAAGTRRPKRTRRARGGARRRRGAGESRVNRETGDNAHFPAPRAALSMHSKHLTLTTRRLRRSSSTGRRLGGRRRPPSRRSSSAVCSAAANGRPLRVASRSRESWSRSSNPQPKRRCPLGPC